MAKLPLRTLEGRALMPSAAIRARMAKEMRALISRMQREVLSELRAAFHADPVPEVVAMDSVYMRQAIEIGVVTPPAYGMDANISEIAAAVITRLTDKWQGIFDVAALRIADNMVGATLNYSDRTAAKSLKEVSKDMTLQVTPALTVYMDAAVQESVALIKRVPGEYLPNVQQDVMRSITTGDGLKDLVPQLEARNVKVRNWADNVARDQTRKAYATVNRVRMQESGVRKFKWVHSGGANQPREHHMHRWPAGLNGGIFSFDDPPVIDERTGEKGFPGQLPYCGCTMSPVIELDESDD